MKKVIVIIGPTSVGKTAMGVALAKQINGEVISGDSMQIYRHCDIGTAKVTKQEMDGVIHHLIDIKDPFESYSVVEFQKNVRLLIDEITCRNHIPIIVGGTGLYIKAALYDYHFSEEKNDRSVMIQKYDNYTNEQLFDWLMQIDPVSAKILHPNNRQRVLRAIEIFETTGKTKSESLDEQQHICLYDAKFIGLTLDRPILYDRINQRVDLMLENGLYEELLKLKELGLSINQQSMQAIGYKEWFDYFEGKYAIEEVIEKIKKNSRNYAKRQYTFFKNQLEVRWFDVDLNDFKNTINEVLKAI